MASQRFHLKPLNKLLISTLFANVELNSPHHSRLSRALHICVPSCLFVYTKSVQKQTRRLAVSVFSSILVCKFGASQRLWAFTTVTTITDDTNTLSCIDSKMRLFSRTKIAASRQSTPDKIKTQHANSPELNKSTSLDAIQLVSEARQIHKHRKGTTHLEALISYFKITIVFPSRSQSWNTSSAATYWHPQVEKLQLFYGLAPGFNSKERAPMLAFSHAVFSYMLPDFLSTLSILVQFSKTNLFYSSQSFSDSTYPTSSRFSSKNRFMLNISFLQPFVPLQITKWLTTHWSSLSIFGIIVFCWTRYTFPIITLTEINSNSFPGCKTPSPRSVLC